MARALSIRKGHELQESRDARRLAVSPSRRLAALSFALVALPSIGLSQIRVDASSTSTNPDGQTWAAAYPTLDAGLAAWSSASPQDIWVAEGLYIPQTGQGRNRTFTIPNDAVVIGGFKTGDGFAETRTGSFRRTILSGDLEDSANSTSSAYHVLTIESGGEQVSLESFTITGGYANGATTDALGGGIYCDDSDLRLEDCALSSNFATNGGALYFNGGSDGDGIRAFDCTFTNNTAFEAGGAIDLPAFGVPTDPSPNYSQSEPSWLYNCDFVDNRAGSIDSGGFPDTASGGGAIHFGEDRLDQASLSFDSTSTGFSIIVYNSRFTDNERWMSR